MPLTAGLWELRMYSKWSVNKKVGEQVLHTIILVDTVRCVQAQVKSQITDIKLEFSRHCCIAVPTYHLRVPGGGMGCCCPPGRAKPPSNARSGFGITFTGAFFR